MSEEIMIPLSARVTREGLVENVEMLNEDASPTQIHDIVDALSRGRLLPAQQGDSPVAVNLVWLFASTTVRPGKTSNEAAPQAPLTSRIRGVSSS